MNVPAASLYDDGRMPADDELRRRLAPALPAVAGRPAVAAYCGSGVSAARDVLALAVLGVDAALFPGSWSAWSNDPDRPAAWARSGPSGGTKPCTRHPDCPQVLWMRLGTGRAVRGMMGGGGKRREKAVTGQGTTPDTC